MAKPKFEVWSMSNRQPWVEAVVRGYIHAKTRSDIFIPKGAIVFLHASKSLWSGWRELEWTSRLDMKTIPRGVVYAVARAKDIGDTGRVMPEGDREYFRMSSGQYVANWMSILFEDVIELPPVACNGTEQPTRKLKDPLKEAILNYPAYTEALRTLMPKQFDDYLLTLDVA